VRRRPLVPRRAPPALLALAAGLASAPASGQTVIYVNGSLAGGGNSGASWADAFRGSDALQRALDAAAPIAGAGQTVQFWVAAGTYVPSVRNDPADPVSFTFVLLSHEELYGGFAGNEATLAERDPEVHVTTLSGELPAGAPYTGRATHVVSALGVDASCIIDGLTISRGYACESYSYSRGGGVFSIGGSPVVRRCRFTSNSSCGRGAGSYCAGGSPRFEDCVFSGNWADRGGGLWCESGTEVVRCTFTSNTATLEGGALWGSGTLSDCTFSVNHAEGGGAILGAAIVCVRCAFMSNTANGGGAIEGTGQAIDCNFDSNSGFDGPGAIHAYSHGFAASGCTFRNHGSNFSAGVGEGSSFTDCTFIGNGSNYGALDAQTLSGCRFFGNSGRYYFATVSGSVVGCVFAGNGGSLNCGGPSVVNCTFAGNQTSNGALNVVAGAPRITNCLFWGNTSGTATGQSIDINSAAGAVVLSYSDVQHLDGSLGGVGNFAADPRLDAEGRLLSLSPCIDSGDNSAVPAGSATDAFGQPRFVDDPGMPNNGPYPPPVDIGAFEFQGTTCYANCDGSTAAPVLNAADFACFLAAFGSGSPYANCDASSTPPRLNVADFGCFLRRFASGCP
jgi:hypothetical protein